MRRRNALLIVAVVVVSLGVATAVSLAGNPVRRVEPLKRITSNFTLEIDGVDAGQFTAVDGLSVEQEVIEYTSDDGQLVRKRPGRTRYGDIVLTRPYSPEDDVLRAWAREINLGRDVRKEVTITIFTRDGGVLKKFICHEVFPVSLKGPTFDGKDPKAMTEEVVLVIDHFDEA